MKVIVNADDYGFHENANQAIAKCFREGSVTNTTAMITMPAFEAGLALARKEGFADRIGLHVNMSDGTPLTDKIKKCRIFCDAEGHFNGNIRTNRVWRFWLPNSVLGAVADEIRAQMKLFFQLGLTERHYDSHGHVGVYWPILPVALECAKEFGFKTTRMFINMSANPHCAKLSLLRRMYINHIDQRILFSGLRKTDYLGNSWDLPRMLAALPQDAVVELLVHPQYRLPDLTLDMQGEMMDWKTPYDKSLGPVFNNRDKYELISFKDLARG
jgi:predicted glycoside hydrolase/deacetylase ChbG (UPF0249 family)